MRAVVAMVIVGVVQAGCLEAATVVCADGRTCPPGNVCNDIHGNCVYPDQLETCLDKDNGEQCFVAGTIAGLCRDQVCLREGCGDGFVGGGEECDDTNLPKTDCLELGYYRPGALSCADDCSYDRSNCEGSCGDAVRDLEEACDKLDLGDVDDCLDLGYYDSGPVTCNDTCSFDTASCTGFCGDSIRNGDEFCDDSDIDDEACFEFGFDAGRVRCASGGCAPLFSGCVDIGWTAVDIPYEAQISALWGSASDDIWAVSRDGSLFSYDGNVWSRRVEALVSAPLNSMWGFSNVNIWAVGADDIAHYNGELWTSTASPVDATLEGVWGAAADDIWAVGALGAIVHYDGTNWSALATTPTATTLNAIWGSSATDVWAVGKAGVVLHYDGSAWSEFDVLANAESLQSVSGFGAGAGEVWIAGYSYQGRGIAYRWDGSAFVDVGIEVVDTYLHALWASGPDDVWIAGGQSEASLGAVWRYDGAQWSEHSTPTAGELYAIWGSAPNDVWAGGFFGGLVHNQGSAWLAESELGWGSLSAVWSLDKNLTWAVGDLAGEALMVSFDGAEWLEHPPGGPTRSLLAVWGSSADDVWAVGVGGQVMHRTTSGWLPVIVPTSANLSGVWGSGPDDIWAVGGSAAVHYLAGEWSATTTGISGVSAIWGSSSDDIWVVGSAGAISHYDGSDWMPIASVVVDVALSSVWGSGPDDVWAVGQFGAVLHYDGSSWDEYPHFVTFDDLLEVWGTAADDAWILTGEGRTFHYDGHGWLPVGLGNNDSAHTIGGAGDIIVVAGGIGFGRALVRMRPWNCRALEDDCDDTIDNDCDGATDAADSDCAI